MPVLPRKGSLEVETPCRYGRVPVGTRSTGWFKLAWSDYLDAYQVKFRFRIGDDPRVVDGMVIYCTDPPKPPALWEYVRQSLVEAVEARRTGRGNQRFRVVRAEWQPATRK